jgi:hypothetical protein
LASVEVRTPSRFIIKLVYLLELGKLALQVKKVARAKPVELAEDKGLVVGISSESRRRARDNHRGYAQALRRAGLEPLPYHVGWLLGA